MYTNAIPKPNIPGMAFYMILTILSRLTPLRLSRIFISKYASAKNNSFSTPKCVNIFFISDILSRTFFIQLFNVNISIFSIHTILKLLLLIPDNSSIEYISLSSFCVHILP